MAAAARSKDPGLPEETARALAAAAWTHLRDIGELDAPEDHVAFGVDVGSRRDTAGGMGERHVEDRRHLPLILAVADQRRVAAGAEGQRGGVEEDGLAGAGFARQHGQTLGEGQIEPVDQDDVADRKLDEHGRFACFRQRGGTGAGGFGSARARNGLSRTEVERKAGQPVMRRKARLIHEPVSSRGVRPWPWISA